MKPWEAIIFVIGLLIGMYFYFIRYDCYNDWDLED